MVKQSEHSAWTGDTHELLDAQIPDVEQLEHIRQLMEKGDMPEDIACEYATMAAAIIDAHKPAKQLLAAADKYIEELEERDAVPRFVAVNLDYLLGHYEKFARTYGYYSIGQLRDYMAHADEDMTEDELDIVVANHDVLQAELLLQMQDGGERVLPLERARGDTVMCAIGFVATREMAYLFEQPTDVATPKSEAPTPAVTPLLKFYEQSGSAARSVQPKDLSLVELATCGPTTQEAPVETVQRAHEMIAKILPEGVEMKKSELKAHILEYLSNTRMDEDAAGKLVDTMYQWHLIGKLSTSNGVLYTCDASQRIQRTRKRKANASEKGAEQIDYIAGGVEYIFDALVGSLKHVQGGMTAREIANAAQDTASVELREDDIKKITRQLKDFFVVGQRSRGSGVVSSKSKSRGATKVLKIGLLNQDVKDRWRDDRNGVLREIKEMQI